MQLFQGQKEEYLQNPQQIINKRGYTSQANSQEKILFLAPIIQNIVHDVIKMLEQDVNGADEDGGDQLVMKTGQFTPEKAKKVYAFAYEKACQYQLSPLKAHLVADAVLDNLYFPFA
jgi:hypothetical protein